MLCTSMDRFGCSIEMEPRTLTEVELKNARITAVDIIQNTNPDEASDIFTEGMKAVSSVKEMEKKAEKNGQLHKLVETNRVGAEVPKGSWDFPCTPTFEEFPDKINTREPLTSPF